MSVSSVNQASTASAQVCPYLTTKSKKSSKPKKSPKPTKAPTPDPKILPADRDGKVNGKWSSKEIGDTILNLDVSDADVLQLVDNLVSDKDVSPTLVSLVEKYVGMRSVRATTKSGIIQAIIETLRTISRNIGR